MEILIRPIITEKASAASEEANCFAFQVDKRANKVQIKKAIESFYGVKVDHVRTMVVPSKKSVRYTKAGMIQGKKSSYKKAIVQVRSGEVIDLYSNI
jgi:large subunit ribosomal protein L23